MDGRMEGPGVGDESMFLPSDGRKKPVAAFQNGRKGSEECEATAGAKSPYVWEGLGHGVKGRTRGMSCRCVWRLVRSLGRATKHPLCRQAGRQAGKRS